jgi:hypothetical protein
MFDIFDPYGFDEDMGFGRSRYTLDGDVDRRSFAAVSGRALRAQNEVGSVINKHILTC